MAMPTPHSIAAEIIRYLKENEVYDLLPEISKELQSEVYRNKDVAIISAVELSKSEKESVEKSLTDKWGEHRFIYSVDSSLLSGMLIRFQDQLIDTTGKYKLTELGHALKS